LREGKYDLAFDLQGNLKSGVITRLSGAPLRFGFDREGVREFPNLFFTNRKAPSRAEDVHVTQKLLRIASAPFGGIPPVSWAYGGIVLSPEEEREARALLDALLPDALPRMLLHAGTTWNSKKMNPGFWAGIVRGVRGRFPGTGVFISWGTEGEKKEAEHISGLCGEGTRILPRRSIRELAAICKVCGYMVGPDTGPLHIAAAVGAKTVSVFRGSDGKYAAPCGSGHRFLQTQFPCAACNIRGEKMCPRDAECRDSIDAEDAAAAMAGLIAERGVES
jgi:heptosyltransferase-1